MSQTTNQPARALHPPAQAPGGQPGFAAKGLSASALKLIAIIAMTCDHVAAAFLMPDSIWYVILRFVGRITGPVMFYFIAVGWRHTKNINKYMLRLGIFAVVSWPAFVFFSTGHFPNAAAWQPFGVIYTLLLCLLAVRARHEIRNSLLRMLAVLALFALSYFGDWQFLGVAITLVFDMFYHNRKQVTVWYCVLVGAFVGVLVLGYVGMVASPDALQAASYGVVSAGGGGYTQSQVLAMMRSEIIIMAGMFLPIILLWFYTGQKGRGGKKLQWFFYIYYPAHLLALGALKVLSNLH